MKGLIVVDSTQKKYLEDRNKKNLPTCWKATNLVCYPHFHSSIEMVYLYDGQMNVTAGGENYLVSKKELLLIPSLTVHRYETSDHSLVGMISLPLGYLPTLKETIKKYTFPTYVLPTGEHAEELEYCFNQLLESEEKMLHSYRIKGYVSNILGMALDNITMEPRENHPEAFQLQNILYYLDTNYLKPLTLDDVASHFGYSKSRFSHIFNENVGCSLTDYLGFLRSRKAADLLIKNDSSIAEIADASGFGSTRSFYRTFQKSFDITPNEYRNLTFEERTRMFNCHPIPAAEECPEKRQKHQQNK